MHSEFLRAICEAPDDDDPRLIYADWLDEQGDPRGEFIRVQCALAAMEQHDPAEFELLDRQTALLEAHREEWERPLRQLVETNSPEGLGSQIIAWLSRRIPPPDGMFVEFHRGLIDSILLELPVFLANAQILVESTPLREVRLMVRRGFGRSTAFSKLAACPHLAKLSSLQIGAVAILPSEVSELGSSSNIGRLTELHLNCSSGLDQSTMLALGDSPMLAKLTKLKLYGQGSLGNDGVATLMNAPAIKGLKSLTLNSVGLTHDGLAPVIRPEGPELEKLDLTSNPLTEAAGPMLRDIRPLRRLELANTLLGDSAVASLATWSGLNGLIYLGLSHNRITDFGAMALIDSPFLRNLTRVNLLENELSPRIVDAIKIRTQGAVVL